MPLSQEEQHQAPLTLQELRVKANQITLARRQARLSYEEHSEEAAQAEYDLKISYGIQFAKHRADGEPVGASEILTDQDTAHLRLDRDLAHAKTKAAQLRIDELEREAALLRHISDRSAGADGLQ